jgi:hypothetical protein
LGKRSLFKRKKIKTNIMPNKKGPYKTGNYDKDMMHERELIYDAKKQEKTGSKETKKHDKELVYDAKGQIHNEDIAKKKHIVNEIAARNSRIA